MQNVNELGTADVVVVGGGVAGLAVARELARLSFRVALVERGELGGESSWAAAGMLAPQAEADYRDLFFDLLCASRDFYPSFAEALVDETGISIELDQTGTLYVALTDEDEQELARRYEWQKQAGLAVESLTGEEARALEPSINAGVRSALRFPNDWQVESRQLVSALELSAKRHGVEIFTGVDVHALRIDRARALGVVTSRGVINSPVTVLAAGAWASLVGAQSVNVPDKTTNLPCPSIEPIRGQVLCYRAPSIARHVIYSARGYIVPRRDGRLLAGSTTEVAGYEKSVTTEGTRLISSNAAEIIPQLMSMTPFESWAGLRPRTSDEWPVIGRSSEIEGLHFALGYYRNGILLAPFAGKLIASIVGGSDSHASEFAAFSAARFRRVEVCSPGR